MKIINNILIHIMPRISFSMMIFIYRVKNFSFLKKINFKTERNYTPFFIVGSGRSGNTLLRAILDYHKQVSIPPESYFIQSLVRIYIDSVLSNKTWNNIVDLCAENISSHKEFYTWQLDVDELKKELKEANEKSLQNIIDSVYLSYSKKHKKGASLWGDKTPMNLLYVHWIIKFFPKAKFINIYRDGRDVVNSYMKSGLITSLKQASIRWNISVNYARKLENNYPDNFISIKYEDLVLDKLNTISKVCIFLSLEFNDELFNYWEKPKNFGDVNMYEHHENVKKPINEKSIGKWKTQLSDEEKIQANKLMSNNLKLMNYL